MSKRIKRVGLKLTASIHARHVKYWRGVALEEDVNLELKSSQIIRFLLYSLNWDFGKNEWIEAVCSFLSVANLWCWIKSLTHLSINVKKSHLGDPFTIATRSLFYLVAFPILRLERWWNFVDIFIFHQQHQVQHAPTTYVLWCMYSKAHLLGYSSVRKKCQKLLFFVETWG